MEFSKNGTQYGAPYSKEKYEIGKIDKYIVPEIKHNNFISPVAVATIPLDELIETIIFHSNISLNMLTTYGGSLLSHNERIWGHSIINGAHIYNISSNIIFDENFINIIILLVSEPE